MKRTFRPVVVSLLALFALTAAPAIAQASPHWYSNGRKAEEGVKVPYVAWGTLVFGTFGDIECENAVTGWDENPEGGGAGISMVTGWNASSCKNAECEAASGHVGVVFENENAPGTNPAMLEWPGTLTEPKANIWRLVTTNVRVFTRCQLGAAQGVPNPEVEEKEVEPAHRIFEREATEFYVGGALCTRSSLSPRLVAGTETAKPSKFQFTSGEGGMLNCGAAGQGFIVGTVKTMGLGADETLTANNP